MIDWNNLRNKDSVVVLYEVLDDPCPYVLFVEVDQYVSELCVKGESLRQRHQSQESFQKLQQACQVFE